MARNGTGSFAKINTYVAGASITAAGHNQNWDDLVSEMTNSVAADGQTTLTGALKGANGSAGTPAYGFASDTNTGAYRIGADNYGIAVGGTKIVDIASTGITITGTLAATEITFSGAAYLAAGTVGAPGLAFTADTDCGLYRIGANNVGVAVNGAKVLDVGTAGLGVTGTLSATSTATVTSASSNALTVGINGATNPALQIDAAVASSATGIKIKSNVATGGTEIVALSSGTNEGMSINAKGSGELVLQNTATGTVSIIRATTITGALTANNAAGITAVNTCKAWGRFTWSGGVPALTEGFNFSSTVADNGTGDLTLTFTNALASATYAAIATAHGIAGTARMAVIQAATTTTLTIHIESDGGSATDPDAISVVVF